MSFYHDFFGYTPTEEVTILLQDFDDHGYAGTSTIPNNYITLGIEPFEYVYETCPTNERFNWVINHELVHVVVSEKATGADNAYRKLFFGKVVADSEAPVSMIYSWLTNPRRYAPRWYHEGNRRIPGNVVGRWHRPRNEWLRRNGVSYDDAG